MYRALAVLEDLGRGGERSKHMKDIKKKFLADKKLQATHHVTEEELRFLESVELFGSLKSVEDLLLILRNVRGTDEKNK
jgi:hypothetical protein